MNGEFQVVDKILDPADNSTGGGAASAVAGAMGAALVGMVARLSIGREGMESEAFYHDVGGAAQLLSTELLDGARDDSDAFRAVQAAFALPKETDEERGRRREAIQAAYIHAAQVPLLNAERSARVLELAGRLRGRSNPNASSDLDCAFYLATGAILGCVANVEINLPAIRNPDLVEQLSHTAEKLHQQALNTARS
jgi:formiminotetrahydrofolate cyclodeaminase